LQVVQYGSGFNVEQIYVPDVYLEVVPPTSYFGGAPTSVAFIDGTASWGPLDSPIAISDPSGTLSAFGGITASAMTDVHDLCTGINQALNQAAGNAGLIVYGVRRGNGSEAESSRAFVDLSVSPQTGLTISARWTGTKGDAINILLAAGQIANTVTATIIPFAGGGTPEVYPNLPSSGSLFWAALANAINNGISGVRGPSRFVTAGTATTTTLGPVLGQFALSGGNDGRTSITTNQLLGNNNGTPSGIYTAQNVLFTPSVLWVAGLTDTTALSALVTFLTKNNIFGLFAFAIGTDVATAISTKATAGIYDYHIGFLLDWQYYFDQVNGDVRLIDPNHACGGRIATLGPWDSPLSKKIQNILGTERNNPYTGNTPYSYAELAQLGAAGIMVVSNPNPGGNTFAFRNGYNSVGNNDATAYVEYSRMTNFLANSLGTILSAFLGELQGFGADDPLRAKVRAAQNTFLAQLASHNYIAGFQVIADLTNNNRVSIAQHRLNDDVLVTYMSSVQVIFTRLQGGTTVVTTQNQTGNSLVPS
jgi:hypothetical protein